MYKKMFAIIFAIAFLGAVLAVQGCSDGDKPKNDNSPSGSKEPPAETPKKAEVSSDEANRKFVAEFDKYLPLAMKDPSDADIRNRISRIDARAISAELAGLRSEFLLLMVYFEKLKGEDPSVYEAIETEISTRVDKTTDWVIAKAGDIVKIVTNSISEVSYGLGGVKTREQGKEETKETQSELSKRAAALADWYAKYETESAKWREAKAPNVDVKITFVAGTIWDDIVLWNRGDPLTCFRVVECKLENADGQNEDINPSLKEIDSFKEGERNKIYGCNLKNVVKVRVCYRSNETGRDTWIVETVPSAISKITD